MTPLRQRMLEDMQLRGFSARTQEAYVRSVRQLAAHFRKPPDQLTKDDLRQYFLYLGMVGRFCPCGVCAGLRCPGREGCAEGPGAKVATSTSTPAGSRASRTARPPGRRPTTTRVDASASCPSREDVAACLVGRSTNRHREIPTDLKRPSFCGVTRAVWLPRRT
jgi:hypothetical protein